MKTAILAIVFGALLACFYPTLNSSFRQLLTSLINSAFTNSPIKASATATATTSNTSSFLKKPALAVPTLESTTFTETIMIPRTIAKVFKAVEKAEGAGARVRRSVGTPHLKNLSPFLMLDHFSVSVGAGFPDHPHRYDTTPLPLLHNDPIYPTMLEVVLTDRRFPREQRPRNHHLSPPRIDRPRGLCGEQGHDQ